MNFLQGASKYLTSEALKQLNHENSLVDTTNPFKNH